jgi:hypothetical protein
MTLIEQMWGSPNEKLHTVGTAFLALSAASFVVMDMQVKSQALTIFSCFAFGVTFAGFAILRNSWSRWRTGEDTLILLRRRGHNAPKVTAVVHSFGWRVSWTGPVAHVDVGTFDVRRLHDRDLPPEGPLFARSYGLFRAAYWMVCSSVAFQGMAGLCATVYGLWLVQFLVTYSQSTI